MDIRGGVLLVAAGLGLVLASGLVDRPYALAQSHGLAQQQMIVRFGVDVLQASNPDRMDPALKWTPVPPPPYPVPPPLQREALAPDDPLRRALPKLERLFRYREYRMLARLSSEGPVGVVQRVAIPGNASLDLTAQGLEARRVRYQVQFREGNHVELRTGLLAPPQAPAILGGTRRGNGVLIIVLSVQPSW